MQRSSHSLLVRLTRVPRPQIVCHDVNGVSISGRRLAACIVWGRLHVRAGGEVPHAWEAPTLILYYTQDS